MSDTEQQVWLSIEDVAKMMQVPPATVRFWRATGDDPRAHVFGRHVRYHVNDVQEWMEARAETHTARTQRRIKAGKV